MQQARHKADYDVEEPYQPIAAAVAVARAAGFRDVVRDKPFTQRYLYSLLFRERV